MRQFWPCGIVIYLYYITNNMAVDLKKFKQFTIPPGSWQSSQTFSEVKTLVSCAARAVAMDAEFFAYDHAAKSCDVGSVDLGSMSGEATMVVMGSAGSLAAPPDKLGLALGNINGDRAFEVILPNGKICPKSAHGIPDFDAVAVAPGSSAMTEYRGVIYVCGGRTSVQSKNCYNHDTTTISGSIPKWNPIQDMNFGDPMIPFGLIPYSDKLFAFAKLTCLSGEKYVQIYDIGGNSWTTEGELMQRKSPQLVQDGNMIYLVGGMECDVNEPVDVIQSYDMASPNDAVTMTKKMCHKNGKHSCALLTRSNGVKGIICTGGATKDNTNLRRKVQFIPLEGDGNCDYLTNEFQDAYNQAALISFGSGHMIYYGGEMNGEFRRSLYAWNQDDEEFALVEGSQATVEDTQDRGFGYISASLVWDKCISFL